MSEEACMVLDWFLWRMSTGVMGEMSLKDRNNHSTALISCNKLQGGLNQISEVEEDESAPIEESPVIGSQVDSISSPVGSFQSLYNS